MKKLNLRFIMTILILALMAGIPVASKTTGLAFAGVVQTGVSSVQKAPVKEKSLIAKVVDVISDAISNTVVSIAKFIRGEEKKPAEDFVKGDPPLMIPKVPTADPPPMIPEPPMPAQVIEPSNQQTTVVAQPAVQAEVKVQTVESVPVTVANVNIPKTAEIKTLTTQTPQVATVAQAPAVSPVSPTVTVTTPKTVTPSYLNLPEKVEVETPAAEVEVIDAPVAEPQIKTQPKITVAENTQTLNNVATVTTTQPKLETNVTTVQPTTLTPTDRTTVVVMQVPAQTTTTTATTSTATLTTTTPQTQQRLNTATTPTTTATVTTTPTTTPTTTTTLATTETNATTETRYAAQTTAGATATTTTQLQTSTVPVCKSEIRTIVPGTIENVVKEGNYSIVTTKEGKKYVVSLCDGSYLECPPGPVAQETQLMQGPPTTQATQLMQATPTAQQTIASLCAIEPAPATVTTATVPATTTRETTTTITPTATITVETTTPTVMDRVIPSAGITNIQVADDGVLYVKDNIIRYVGGSAQITIAEDVCGNYIFDIFPKETNEGLKLSFVAMKNGVDVTDQFTVSVTAVNDEGLDVSPLVTMTEPGMALLKSSVALGIGSVSKVAPEAEYVPSEGENVLEKITVSLKADKTQASTATPALSCSSEKVYLAIGKAQTPPMVDSALLSSTDAPGGDVTLQQQTPDIGGHVIGGGCSLIRR